MKEGRKLGEGSAEGSQGSHLVAGKVLRTEVLTEQYLEFLLHGVQERGEESSKVVN